VAWAYWEVGQVIECSAAVAVAAMRSGLVEVAEQGSTVVVVTGGNIDDELLAELTGA